MRRLAAVVIVMLLLPHGVALGVDLDELLEESRSASYSAEQLITCVTPDGIRDALIELEQLDGQVRYYGTSQDGPEVWSGYGDFVVTDDAPAADSSSGSEPEALETVDARYIVEAGPQTLHLGRRADTYVLRDGDLARAELIVDRATGVLLNVVTFDSEGNVYCERTFVDYSPNAPQWDPASAALSSEQLLATSDTQLPDELAGFARLDAYVDSAGLNFGYYSDGFFSFAVFESNVEIVLDGGVGHFFNGHMYKREFTPGQVTYTWLVRDGGMALIGDLPPDMHDAVLEALPTPYDAGFFRRLWRSLFG